MNPASKRFRIVAVALTPLLVHQTTLPRTRVGGYEREAADAFLREVANDYEAVWMERQGLRERVERLESELGNLRDLERLVSDALIAAERAADEVTAEARQEADTILEEAKARAKQIVGEAAHDREQQEAEVERLRSLAVEARSDLSGFLMETLQRLRADGAEAAASPR